MTLYGGRHADHRRFANSFFAYCLASYGVIAAGTRRRGDEFAGAADIEARGQVGLHVRF